MFVYYYIILYHILLYYVILRKVGNGKRWQRLLRLAHSSRKEKCQQKVNSNLKNEYTL